VAIDALDANDLYRILTEAEGSVLKQYEKEFRSYGVNLTSDEEGLRRVAELAVEEKTGARALVTVLEKALRDFKFELPSAPCKELKLTKELMDDPEGVLRTLLSSHECVTSGCQMWIEEVERLFEVRIDLDEDVRRKIIDDCALTSQSAHSLLDARLRNTGVLLGLQEIWKATSGNVDLLKISAAMYDNPKEEIEKWKNSLKGMSSSRS